MCVYLWLQTCLPQIDALGTDKVFLNWIEKKKVQNNIILYICNKIQEIVFMGFKPPVNDLYINS